MLYALLNAPITLMSAMLMAGLLVWLLINRSKFSGSIKWHFSPRSHSIELRTTVLYVDSPPDPAQRRPRVQQGGEMESDQQLDDLPDVPARSPPSSTIVNDYDSKTEPRLKLVVLGLEWPSRFLDDALITLIVELCKKELGFILNPMEIEIISKKLAGKESRSLVCFSLPKSVARALLRCKWCLRNGANGLTIGVFQNRRNCQIDYKLRKKLKSVAGLSPSVEPPPPVSPLTPQSTSTLPPIAPVALRFSSPTIPKASVPEKPVPGKDFERAVKIHGEKVDPQSGRPIYMVEFEGYKDQLWECRTVTKELKDAWQKKARKGGKQKCKPKSKTNKKVSVRKQQTRSAGVAPVSISAVPGTMISPAVDPSDAGTVVETSLGTVEQGCRRSLRTQGINPQFSGLKK